MEIKYDPMHPGSFEKEWPIHRNCREWWYATGVLFDDKKNMYSYQYTLLNLNFGAITLHMPMCALTDFKNHRHYYIQEPHLSGKGMTVTENEASFLGVASVKKSEKGMTISIQHKDFSLGLFADYGKGAFWHCDHGRLQMGKSGKKETTLYYSYTNMPTSGYVVLHDRILHLTGKTWFDRQGGTYSITDPETNWEWFSLRFFDDEEIMLFTFHDSRYNDGTYIRKDGTSARLNRYQMERTKTVTCSGLKWSAGWKVSCACKEKEYTIEPIQKGHINFAYFEELCYIRNSRNEIVGYAFAELLPGILNGKGRENETVGARTSNLFQRIER